MPGRMPNEPRIFVGKQILFGRMRKHGFSHYEVLDVRALESAPWGRTLLVANFEDHFISSMR